MAKVTETKQLENFRITLADGRILVYPRGEYGPVGCQSSYITEHRPDFFKPGDYILGQQASDGESFKILDMITKIELIEGDQLSEVWP